MSRLFYSEIQQALDERPYHWTRSARESRRRTQGRSAFAVLPLLSFSTTATRPRPQLLVRMSQITKFLHNKSLVTSQLNDATIADWLKPSRGEAMARLRTNGLSLLTAVVLTHLLPVPSPWTAISVLRERIPASGVYYLLCSVGTCQRRVDRRDEVFNLLKRRGAPACRPQHQHPASDIRTEISTRHGCTTSKTIAC